MGLHPYRLSFFALNVLRHFTIQWDLVCDRAELVPLSQSILMVGTIVGALIFGHISDRIGRRPVLMISLFSQACLGFVMALSPNYWFFLVVRFFSGMFDQVSKAMNQNERNKLFKLANEDCKPVFFVCH